MNIDNLRIGTRLSIGFGAVLMLLSAVAIVAYWQFGTARQGLARMVEAQRRVGLSQEWLGKTQLNVTRAIALAKANGQPDLSNHFEPLIRKTTDEINALQKAIEGMSTSDESKALLATVAQRRTVYVDLRARLFEGLKQTDQSAVAALLNDKLLPAAESYMGEMAAVLARNEADAATVSASSSANLQSATSVLELLVLASLAVGIAMAYFITRSITVPLGEALNVAKVIAGSDLSQHIESARRDESGDLLRALGQMQQALRGMVHRVRDASDSIRTASAEIATGNHDLSARTEQTASNLQQAASSMEQLTGTVRQSADSARHANQLASSAAEVAARGGEVVSRVVMTMDDINTSSRQIADIIGVIDGIAFQTNILALNAAVEAARAGEQGRGFAVVAGEVRSLAQRSAGAAREIKTLIGASVDKVEGGARLVADAGRTMTEIVSSVQRVSDIIGEITASAAEQSQGIGEVNTSVSQLDRMTQQNAALVEESAAAAQALEDQAVTLSKLVDAFRLAGPEGTPVDVAAPRAAVAKAVVPSARPRAVPVAKPAPIPTPTQAIGPAPKPSAKPAPKPAVVAALATTDEWETF